MERMNYLDVDIEEKKYNINIDDELYEESIDDLNNLKPLDFQKYNYLLNLDINFFLNWTKNHQTYNKLHEREIIIRNKKL